ncbi:hypothetical protein ACW14X_28815 [Nocardioides sp. YJ-D4]
MAEQSTRRVHSGLVALAGVVIAVLAGLGLARVEVSTDLESFLPAHDQSLTDYHAVAKEFGGDPIVVLLETRGSTSLLSPKALRSEVELEGELAKLDGVASLYGPGTLLNQVAGRAQDLLLELIGRRDAEVAKAQIDAENAGRSPEAAAEKVKAKFDSRYGPLLVRGLPAGLPTLGNEKFVKQVVFDDSGLPRGSWKLVVPDERTLAILVRPDSSLNAREMSHLISQIQDAVGSSDLDAKVSSGKGKGDLRTTVSGSSVLVSALSDRAVHDMPLLGGLAVGAVCLAFWAAGWIRRSRRLLPVATTLVAVLLAVSALGWLGRPVTVAVLAFSSVLLGIGCYYPTYLMRSARPRTFVTVVCASAVSVATLALSPLPIIADLGLLLGLGILFSGAVAWLARGWLQEAENTTDTARWRPSRRASRVAAAGLLVLGLVGIGGWFQLGQLPLRSDVNHFAAGLPALDDAHRVENALDMSGEVTVELNGSDTLSPSGLGWMQTAYARVIEQHGDDLRSVVSPPALLAFLGTDPSAEEIDAAYRLLPGYLTRAVISPDRSTSAMVYGVKTHDLESAGRSIDDLRASLPEQPEGYQVRVAGLPVVMVQAEQLVSDDRYRANILGIAAAGAVLLIGLRRRTDALRGALAATLATGTGFFLVAVAGIGLNPVTGALGALTAAVGCEFTVMLAESVRSSSSLRRAVVLAAITSALGYAVLLASGLAVVREFGLMLAGGVGLAMLCSWVVVVATVRAPMDPRAEAESVTITEPSETREAMDGSLV